MSRPRGTTCPVIGTSIATGETVRLTGSVAMYAEDFDPAKISLCINGKRKKHGGFTWVRDPEYVPPVVAPPHPRHRAVPVIGTNEATGEVIRLVGRAEICAAGFNPGCVSRACNGLQYLHKGWRFRFEHAGK